MIVSDATAIITLINIDRFEILHLMFDHIIMTSEVYDEIAVKPRAKNYLDQEIDLGFVQIEQYKDKQLFKEINFVLDRGEAASITLALEQKKPLIIDEKKGRNFAKRQGIEIIGLVGILRFLYLNEMMNEAETRELIERLNSSDFRISSHLIDLIIEER